MKLTLGGLFHYDALFIMVRLTAIVSNGLNTKTVLEHLFYFD
jgi:hypothetical protein